ncbi:MAG TPA: hypothetical protein ENN43_03945 [bacterium]|nr:hypothetical protein [bacterium]
MSEGTPKPKVYVEKRGGKEVTIIKGLHTWGKERLEKTARDIKKKTGCGGTVKDGIIELQGDLRGNSKFKAEILKLFH